MRLHLDFETRSMLDIKKVGLDRYARSAEVLMLAWAFGDEEPRLWLPSNGPMPSRLLLDGFANPDVVKVAWNKRFEQEILKHALGLNIPNVEWLDPAVLARVGTLPGSLDGASKYLNLGDMAKHGKDGKRLINKFSKPYKGKFRRPEDHPDDWQLFQDYCKQDVRAERAALHILEKLFPLTPFEQQVERIDAEINACGIPVDMQFVREAEKLVAAEKADLARRIQAMTGLENPNSKPQMLGWLRAHNYPFSSMKKTKVDEYLSERYAEVNVPDPDVTAVLRLHQKLSRSSTSKLDAMLDRVGPDDVLRHSYKYLGADRTGRWSGEGVQLQNLPR